MEKWANKICGCYCMNNNLIAYLHYRNGNGNYDKAVGYL